MKGWWLKFGCSLIGYKYELLKHCCIASEKAVVKYTSAVLLICLIWGFVGYTFTFHYIQRGLTAPIIGAIISVFVVIQIERQIILTMKIHRVVAAFRIIIGIIVAIIGSIIIDQILFKEDIHKQKEITVRNKVIDDLDSQMIKIGDEIANKEIELTGLFEKYKNEPTVAAVGLGEYTYGPDPNDSSGNKLKIVGRKYHDQSVENPIAKNIPITQSVIEKLREQKNDISRRKIKIIAGEKVYDGENDETENGFLDELAVMKLILFSHKEALFVWFLFFTFFLAIELFVLVNKFYDKDNDYEKLVLHQMNIRIEQLKALNLNRDQSGQS